MKRFAIGVLMGLAFVLGVLVHLGLHPDAAEIARLDADRQKLADDLLAIINLHTSSIKNLTGSVNINHQRIERLEKFVWAIRDDTAAALRTLADVREWAEKELEAARHIVAAEDVAGSRYLARGMESSLTALLALIDRAEAKGE